MIPLCTEGVLVLAYQWGSVGAKKIIQDLNGYLFCVVSQSSWVT